MKNHTFSDSPHSPPLNTQESDKQDNVSENSEKGKHEKEEMKNTTSNLQLIQVQPRKSSLIKILKDQGQLHVQVKGAAHFYSRSTSPLYKPQNRDMDFALGYTPIFSGRRLTGPPALPKSLKLQETTSQIATPDQMGRESRIRSPSKTQSYSPVSKFKLAFSERIDPIINDENFQRYKVKQSRLTKVIEQRYLTDKQTIKKVYEKNGPNQKLKRVSLKNANIDTFQMRKRDFQKIKDFKNAVIDLKLHPEAKTMWSQSSHPLASLKMIEFLKKTRNNQELLSKTFTNKMREYSEDKIDETWFNDRFSSKTDRKQIDKYAQFEKQEGFSKVKVYPKEEQPKRIKKIVIKNAGTQELNSILSRLNNPSNKKVIDMRHLLKHKNKRDVVHSKAIGQAVQEFKRKYLDQNLGELNSTYEHFLSSKE